MVSHSTLHRFPRIDTAFSPGETLPPFPKPTHGTTPGLKPFVTIKDCIGRIKERDLTPVMGYSTKKDERPYDSRVQLKQCITTDGGAGAYFGGRYP